MGMYERIIQCCEMRKTTPGAVCNELGIRRALITELKTGRTKELSSFNVARFANYFGVSCDWLITGIETLNSYSDDELKLINCWRRADDATRENIAFMLRDYGMTLSSAKEEQSQVS